MRLIDNYPSVQHRATSRATEREEVSPTVFPPRPGSTCYLHEPTLYTKPIAAVVLDPENPVHISRWGRIAVEEAVANAEALRAVPIWVSRSRDLHPDKATPSELIHGKAERIILVVPESLSVCRPNHSARAYAA